jgi:hypothetical protein
VADEISTLHILPAGNFTRLAQAVLSLGSTKKLRRDLQNATLLLQKRNLKSAAALLSSLAVSIEYLDHLRGRVWPGCIEK